MSPADDCRKALESLIAQKDGAYSERNQCVALIAKLACALGFNVGLGQHPAEDKDWDPDWRTIVFVDLPTGQLSWHIQDAERHLFDGHPTYNREWDGHSTDEKYRRMKEWRP